jgi:hypothetical protein
VSEARQALDRTKGVAGTTRGTVSVAGQLIAAGSTVDIPLTVRGAMPGDSVRLEPPSTLVAGLIKSHESVTGVGAVTLRLSNVTGGGVSLVTADWRFVVTRPK